MKKTKRGILSIVLALVIVTCMVPLGTFTSFAIDSGTFTDLQEMVMLADDGDTIQLDKDYVCIENDLETVQIKNDDESGKTLTIDLNGHKIIGNSDSSCIDVVSSSKLILNDDSLSGGGTISSGCDGVFINENGTLIANNIYFTDNFEGIYNSKGCAIIEICEFTNNICGILNYGKTAITDTIITGSKFGIFNSGNLYIGGTTKVTDNNSNIFIEKDIYNYVGAGAYGYEIHDFCPITLGDGAPIEELGGYIVAAPTDGFAAGVTKWEYEYITPMYYDEVNMIWYYIPCVFETVTDKPCAGAFTTNGTADDVKYFFADDSAFTVAYNDNGYLELLAPATDITNIETTPTKIWTSADYTVTVTGRAVKIQFIDAKGNTWTYPRDKATIVSYDKDGNVVDSDSRVVAYEVWTVTAKLPAGDYKVKAKYSGSGWQTDDVKDYGFTVTNEASTDIELISATLESTSGPRGRVTATVVTGSEVQKVQLAMNGTTNTVSDFVDNGNGTKTFTLTAVTVKGENEITVKVKYDNQWHDADTLTYTAN